MPTINPPPELSEWVDNEGFAHIRLQPMILNVHRRHCDLSLIYLFITYLFITEQYPCDLNRLLFPAYSQNSTTALVRFLVSGRL